MHTATAAGRAMPALRPYQMDALDSIVAAARPIGSALAGLNRLLLKKPTGTGKTVTFSALPTWPGIVDWLAQFPKGERRMLVIAHREELLDQAADKILAQHPGWHVSIEQGDRHASRFSDVVVASVQTLAAMKFRRLERLMAHGAFRLVIVDEAHHAAAKTYRATLARLGFLPSVDAGEDGEIDAATWDDVAAMEAALKDWDARAPKDRLLVGCTATPNRSDAVGLGCVFQTIAYSYALKEAIRDGWLVPPVPWVVETDTSLDDVRVQRGEFNQRDLAEAVNTAQRNDLAVAGWFDHAEGRPTIAFTVDVAHAHALADTFRARGVRVLAISGETPTEDRRIGLRQYTEGQIDVLTNCMVLTEGTDLPRTSCILHAKPTKSATLYEQMSGRGLRLFPGKVDCVLLDVVDVARRHSLQTAPVLYGLPPALVVNGQALGAIEDELAALREKFPALDVDGQLAQGRLTLDQLRAKAVSFDIWQIEPLGAVGEGLACNWIKVGADTYRLQYPWQDETETVTVAPDLLGHFDVSCTIRPVAIQGAKPPAARSRTLAAGVADARGALALAEAYVREHRGAVMKLKDRDAGWRGASASPKQLALLARFKVPHNPKTITRGEASDLIDLAFARKGAGRR